jgi:hypothetical protein
MPLFFFVKEPWLGELRISVFLSIASIFGIGTKSPVPWESRTFSTFRITEFTLIKLVNTCVLFRVSAPEYPWIRIFPNQQCRRILAPILPRHFGSSWFVPLPRPKTELPATIANSRPKPNKVLKFLAPNVALDLFFERQNIHCRFFKNLSGAKQPK